jgi:hypothetical protein
MSAVMGGATVHNVQHLWQSCQSTCAHVVSCHNVAPDNSSRVVGACKQTAQSVVQGSQSGLVSR